MRGIIEMLTGNVELELRCNRCDDENGFAAMMEVWQGIAVGVGDYLVYECPMCKAQILVLCRMRTKPQ